MRQPEAVILPEEYALVMGDVTAVLVKRILQLDVQPAYHDDPDRTYGMTVAGWNVRWRTGPDSTLVVYEVTPRETPK